VIKAPKAYLVDSALAIAAARESTPTGFHFETFVANDLQVWREQAPRRGLFHWRVAQQEVDFVLQEADKLLPLEVKTSAEVSSRDARNLRAFRAAHPNSPRGILLSSDPSIRVLDHGIIAAPFWAVL
jgi:predicted AAA+ superfamily ATPase